MTSLINIALAGFLVWTGESGTAHGEIIKNPAPVTPKIETISVRLTGYNALAEQTDGDPEVTASGASSNPEVIVARSRDLADTLPYGTVISIEVPNDAVSCGFAEVEHLIGYRVLADTMSERKLKQIDVMFNKSDKVRIDGKIRNPAVAVGVCKANIRVVGKIALKDIPDTQAELTIMVSKQLAVR